MRDIISNYSTSSFLCSGCMWMWKSVPRKASGRGDAYYPHFVVVMTHARLLDAVRNGDLVRLGEDGPAGGEQRTALKACRDRQSGLWGLRCGNKITVIPQYREVFDICANRAAVRFKDGRTGVVDDSGTP